MRITRPTPGQIGGGILLALALTALPRAAAQPRIEWRRTFGGAYYDLAYSVQQTTDGGYIVAGTTESFGDHRSLDVYLIKTDPNGGMVWQRTFGGAQGDRAYCVRQTSDGGYILVGYTGPWYGSEDVYLVKTDPSGNLQWERTFGGPQPDVGCSVQQATDGGYLVAGWTESFGAGSSDVYLVLLRCEIPAPIASKTRPTEAVSSRGN